MYEDAPDPRDGAVPGYSKDNDESITLIQYSPSNRTEDNNTSSNSSTSKNIHAKREKYKNRSYESIIMKYADRMKENYEKSQETVMTQTKEYV